MPLEHLTIRNFAIIDRLDIELGDELTIITGETGAGKSIIFSALSLLLGARADSSLIRHGSADCEITAQFSLAEGDSSLQWLRNRELDSDDACIVRRVIRREKPGKCYINDRPVTLSSVRELGQALVDIHGQHEHQALLRPRVQRQILDSFAGISDQVLELATLYRSVRNLTQKLDHLEKNLKDRTDRIDLLSFQVKELNDAAIQPTEFADLETEQRRLGNARELIDGMQKTVSSLYEAEENSVSSALAAAIENLKRLAEFDPRLGEPVEILNSALAQTDEAASQVLQLRDSAEHDPARLDWVEARMDTLISLARKHRCPEDELLLRLQELTKELASAEDEGQEPESIRTELVKVTTEYQGLAEEIGNSRRRTAGELSALVTGQMQDLGMEGGRFVIDVSPLADDEMGEHGLDQIEFLVSTNPGVPPRSITRTASGGELSRISLAIEVVNSEASHVPTLMFDEVDVGVGGKVAEIVGQRLRELGKHAQVLSVTHLPQVAAQGNRHLLVTKTADKSKEITYSEIVLLDEDQRVRELARMLGGMEITEQTLAHANEMLRQAS